MHRMSTAVSPRPVSPEAVIDEPGLFHLSSLNSREIGRPWSPVDPPLAAVPESALHESAELPEKHNLEMAFAPASLEPSASTPAPDLTLPLDDLPAFPPPLDEAPVRSLPQAEHGIPSPADDRAEFDGDMDMASCALQTAVTDPESDEPASVAKGSPFAEAPLPATSTAPTEATNCGEVASSSIPALALPLNGTSHAGRSGAAPARIGSGRLVPARLTWKPRDPFAAGARPEMGRFRWELMLTSACITAVCGLGCVWLLRTLLA